jgi:hypothetical protein
MVAAAEVAKYNQWTLNEMRDRQAKLAKLAMKTWPIESMMWRELPDHWRSGR